MKPLSRIIPHCHMQKSVDEHPNAKLHRRDQNRASGAPQKKRSPPPKAVDAPNDHKASTTREHHARMCPAAPKKLDESVSHTAKKKEKSRFAKRLHRESRTEKDRRFHSLFTLGFPFAAVRSHAIAAERPPSSSISPSRTAFLPSKIVPTSVTSSVCE